MQNLTVNLLAPLATSRSIPSQPLGDRGIWGLLIQPPKPPKPPEPLAIELIKGFAEVRPIFRPFVRVAMMRYRDLRLTNPSSHSLPTRRFLTRFG